MLQKISSDDKMIGQKEQLKVRILDGKPCSPAMHSL
jgi:hypothetical protein